FNGVLFAKKTNIISNPQFPRKLFGMRSFGTITDHKQFAGYFLLHFFEYSDHIRCPFYFSEIRGMYQYPFVARCNSLLEMLTWPEAETVKINKIGYDTDLPCDVEMLQCFFL